jgi:Cu/Ag efflux protein CusF
MKRRIFLQGILAAGLASAMRAQAKPAQPVIQVYKSATCGCCFAWVDHLQANGFTVTAQNVPNPSDYREKYGIPQQLGSCHTGVVDGYALEGHVPAREVKRLLAERPKARGLAVPGMPLGSPGMEVEGERSDAYDVMLVKADGTHSVYSHYEGKPAPPAIAQSANVRAALTEGEVRKVDKGTGKLTIKHGPITNLDMPGMTMVFQVKDKTMLDEVKRGDKIRFVADKVSGAYTVVKLDVVN